MKSIRPQAGFTILELTVAAMIFSAVLITVVVGVVAFTGSYYKGINGSNVQTTTRQALENITQAIQFSGGTVVTHATSTSGYDYFCAGSTVYAYNGSAPQYDGGTNINNIGLYAVPSPAGDCADPKGDLSGGHELLQKGMRLSYVNLAQSGSNWTVSLVVAYGKGNLLCDAGLSSGTGSCVPGADANAPDANVSGQRVQCRAGQGSQYCYVAKLGAIVQPRIGN